MMRSRKYHIDSEMLVQTLVVSSGTEYQCGMGERLYGAIQSLALLPSHLSFDCPPDCLLNILRNVTGLMRGRATCGIIHACLHQH